MPNALANNGFSVDGANWLSPGHHTLRLIIGGVSGRDGEGSRSLLLPVDLNVVGGDL